MLMTAFVGNTNLLELIGLTDEVEEEFINDALVTVTVKTSAGVEVEGDEFPLTMEYVTASDGDYRCVLTSELELTAKAHYIAFIDANATTSADERVGHWEFPFTPLKRTGIDE